MQSLQDELDCSFDSDCTITNNQEPTRHESKVLKPGRRTSPDDDDDEDFNDHYQSADDSRLREWRNKSHMEHSTRHQTSRKLKREYSYSGDDWGDPADDSDPDGRFTSLDHTIEDLLECLSLNPDSAYESEEEDGVDAHTTVRFIHELQFLPSQEELEYITSKLVDLHKSLYIKTKAHLSEFRELAQFRWATGPEEALDEAIASVLRSFPSIDARLWNELILLEAENNALLADLSLLNDSLQITRQLTIQAQRSLKSAREIVDQWKADIAGVDRAQKWLTDREEKLSSASTTQELQMIRNGFEEVCSQLRLQIEAPG